MGRGKETRMHMRVRACVCVCVRVRARARARACVCVCGCSGGVCGLEELALVRRAVAVQRKRDAAVLGILVGEGEAGAEGRLRADDAVAPVKVVVGLCANAGRGRCDAGAMRCECGEDAGLQHSERSRGCEGCAIWRGRLRRWLPVRMPPEYRTGRGAMAGAPCPAVCGGSTLYMCIDPPLPLAGPIYLPSSSPSTSATVEPRVYW